MNHGSLPTFERLSIICGDFTASPIAAPSALTISGGVLDGTNAPSQLSTTTLKPDSDIVGTSGRNDERLAPVTARMRIVPALACVMLSLIGLTLAGTWPPIRSCSAGAPPR